MPHRLLARRLVLASLDAAIRKARREVRWCRMVLSFRTMLGRDTACAAILLRRAERRLKLLVEDRRQAAAAFAAGASRTVRVRAGPAWPPAKADKP